ncbi:MAG: hypothetical protein ACRDI2_00535 [Chloroflexota bacterium]
MTASAPPAPLAAGSPAIRGQLFAAGIRAAFISAMAVGGAALLAGTDPFVATGWGLFSFFVVGLAGWAAEVSLGPSLEQIALERERRAQEATRAARAAAREAASLGLAAGGAARPPTLDVTLPEEGAVPAAPPLPGGRPMDPARPPAAANAPEEEFRDLASLFRSGPEGAVPAA